VLHVTARAVATHALSIFGDHSDVMAARSTGWTMLSSNTPQEAQDLALVAHAAALASRIPVLHFFDGFRTSHEVSKLAALEDDDIAAMIDATAVAAHRGRALSPDHPVMRGSAQKPRRLLPVARSLQPVLRRVPGDRAVGDAPVRRDHRAAVPPVRLRRRSRCRARHRHHGIGRRSGGRGRGRDECGR
jgi:pyruvate-ferredoxin/flavodoxin oxidoreductase